MTLLEKAKSGEITAEMQYVAEKEGVTPEFICEGVAKGEIVILHSSRKNIHPVAVGKGLFTKVSALSLIHIEMCIRDRYHTL